MISSEVRCGWRVSGRVQGVGFRWWTQRAASALGLRGWVRNRPDGRVEVRAVGSAEAIRELEEALHRGPASARVEKVERVEGEPAEAEVPRDGFEIRR